MMYRVWRKNYYGKYNGFDEVEAMSPQDAIKSVQDFDYDTGDMTSYTYEVEEVQSKEREEIRRRSRNTGLIPCLGKAGYLPTDDDKPQ